MDFYLLKRKECFTVTCVLTGRLRNIKRINSFCVKNTKLCVCSTWLPVKLCYRSHLCCSGGILPDSVFARYVIPRIVDLFKSRLVHVRLVLLENFSKFVHLFEKSVLHDVVLPEVSACLTYVITENYTEVLQ